VRQDLLADFELLIDDRRDALGLAASMTERILVPKTPFETARSSSASRSGIGFISLTPFSGSARPLSTFRNGTTPRFSHRYRAVGTPSISRSMVCSNRIAPITLSPVKAGDLMIRLRIDERDRTSRHHSTRRFPGRRRVSAPSASNRPTGRAPR
jgi:hypothetical protein